MDTFYEIDLFLHQKQRRGVVIAENKEEGFCAIIWSVKNNINGKP